MKYIRSITAGLIAVLVAFALVASRGPHNLDSVLYFLAVVVMARRQLWPIIAGVFLGGFVLWLWWEDRDKNTDRPSN